MSDFDVSSLSDASDIFGIHFGVDPRDKEYLERKLERYVTIHRSLHDIYTQRCHPGSLQWFFNSDAYQRWVHAPSESDHVGPAAASSTLFCPGAPGVGKTMLASAIIQDVTRRFLSRPNSAVGIAYLYCDFGLQQEQTSTNLLFSLFQQLVKSPTTWAIEKLQDDYMIGIRPSVARIAKVLQETVTGYTQVFMIIDALDECDQQHRRILLKVIFRLQTMCPIHLLATSDVDPKIVALFTKADVLEIRADKEDMRAYLAGRMSRALSATGDNAELEEEISSSIVGAADGRFLLASLYLECLSRQISTKALRDTLARLATGSHSDNYDAAYDGVLKGIENQAPCQANLAKKSLLYMALARRPLTGHELQHAIAVDAGVAEPTLGSVHFVRDVIVACQGLAVITGSEQNESEQGDGTIGLRLVHRTAYNSLQRTLTRWFPEGRNRFAKTCVTALSLPAFETGPCPTRQELEHRLRAFPFYRYAASNWGHHARSVTAGFQELERIAIMGLDLPESQPKIESASQILFLAQQLIPREPDFKSFPRRMGALHVAGYFGFTAMIRRLLSKGRSILAKDSYGRTALAWAAAEGHEEAVRLLLEGAKTAGINMDPNTRDRWGRTPISLASERCNTAVVQLLLRHGANPDLKDFGKEAPLLYVARGGHTAIAALLIRHGVDVDIRGGPGDDFGCTPLSLAAKHGHADIVRLLLTDEGLQPWASPGHWQPISETPLWLAAEHGHGDIVEMLLDHEGINQDQFIDSSKGTPLHVAAENGHLDVVQLLLKRSFDVNAQTQFGETPLLGAVSMGHDSVVASLLSQAGVMLDLAGTDGPPPILEAVNRRQTGALRLLLAHKANAQVRDERGRTPLALSAFHGFEQGVELLLATDGVDPDEKDNEGLTPLFLAVLHTHEPESDGRRRIVRCLLDSGRVDVNIRDAGGMTPVMHALGNGCRSLCRMLLECEQLDVHAKDQDGMTPLLWAIKMNDQDTVALLLARGSSPNVSDTQGETALSHVAWVGKSSIAEMLLGQPGVDPDHRNNYGQTPLSLAASGANAEVVELLLATGRVDVNSRDSSGETPLHHVLAKDYDPEEKSTVVKLLLATSDIEPDCKDQAGRTPLCVAAGSRRVGIAAMLLATGRVDVNSQDKEGWAPLHYAAHYGCGPMVERLLAETNVEPNCRDVRGRTPLSWAAEAGRIKAVESFLSHSGVMRDARNNVGRTPLSLAVGRAPSSESRPEEDGVEREWVVQQLLLADGVDPDAEDETGWTPLWWAVESRNGTMVDKLLEHGAGRIDLDHVDKKGRTPLELALEAGSEVIKGMLLAAGARLSAGSTEETNHNRELLLPGTDSTDIPPDGDDYNSSSHSILNRAGCSMWRHIVLGVELSAQGEEDCQGVDNEEELCAQCDALDIDRLFSRCPLGISKGLLVSKVGNMDKRSRSCPMCRLMAAVKPVLDDDLDAANCELRAFSSNHKWLGIDQQEGLSSDWVDTVFLGVMPPGKRQATMPWPFGFISRVGSNDEYRENALTVNRLRTDAIDYRKIRSWIDCCEVYHGRPCNTPTSRQIPHLRLIDCKSPELAIVAPSETVPFVALSYVWGGRKDGPDKAEYALIRDAITVTLRLGYRYLWIDRYCTLKSDPKVFSSQLQAMNTVYEKAQVTIIAAACDDPTSGLPGVSDRPMIRQPCFRVKGHVLTVIPPDPCYDVHKSTWRTRGWTFQEGILSRRRLVFTEKEVFYECQGMVIREAVEVPLRFHKVVASSPSRRLFKHQERAFPRKGIKTSRLKYRSIWPLIAEYTTRQLTYDSDILNAMLGIFDGLSEREPPIHHMCGVPAVAENDRLLEGFTRGLCWVLLEPGTRRQEFPSWSWTGWRGLVDGLSSSTPALKEGYSIKVDIINPLADTSAQMLSWTEFERLDPSGRANLLQLCHLQITGAAIEVDLWQGEKNLDSVRSLDKDETGWHAMIYNGNDVIDGTLYLCKDPAGDAEFARRLTEERWFAIVLGNSGARTNRGLMLILVEKIQSCWERIGLIKSRACDSMDLNSLKEQTFVLN